MNPVFQTLRAALNAGYAIYGRSNAFGYTVRTRDQAGWHYASVICGTNRAI